MKTILNSIALGSVTSLMAVCPSGACGHMDYYQNQPGMGYSQNQPGESYYQSQIGQEGFYQNQPGQGYFRNIPEGRSQRLEGRSQRLEGLNQRFQEGQNQQLQDGQNQQGQGYYRNIPEGLNQRLQNRGSFQDQERGTNQANPQNRARNQEPQQSSMNWRQKSKQIANNNDMMRSDMMSWGSSTETQGTDRSSQGTDRSSQGTGSQYDRYDRSSQGTGSQWDRSSQGTETKSQWDRSSKDPTDQWENETQDQLQNRGTQQNSQMNPQGYNPRMSSTYRRAISDSAADMKAGKASQDTAASESDKQLNTRIRERLKEAKIQGFDTLILRTSNGVVIISGEVNSPADVQKITEKLKNLQGIKAVRNQTTARSPQPAGATPSGTSSPSSSY